MKHLLPATAAILCILWMTMTSYAATENITEDRQYFYTTSAFNTYNSAQIYLEGTGVRIVRQGYQQGAEPDEAHLRRNQQIVFSQALEWQEEAVEGQYYGYTAELDIGELEDGEYVLSIESGAVKWVEDSFGETAGFRTPYTLAAVRLVKQGGQCYFPEEDSLSLRYNNSLLQLLQAGNAPNDFTILKEFYQQQQSNSTLIEIEKEAKALTAGLGSDLEKCLAIEQWITQNIAYDFAFPRRNIDDWLNEHPEDTVRLEDALNAFEQGYAQCYGYAKLTTLMLGYAGVESVYIRGYYEADVSDMLNSTELSGQYSSSWNTSVPDSWFYRASDGTQIPDIYNHAWNAVKISGSWYFLDTCRDAVYGYYRTSSEDSGTSYIKLNQCYSGIHVFPTPQQLSGTHIPIRYGASRYGEKVKEM